MVPDGLQGLKFIHSFPEVPPPYDVYTHWGTQHSFFFSFLFKGKKEYIDPTHVKVKAVVKVQGPFIVLQVKVCVAHWTKTVSL